MKFTPTTQLKYHKVKVLHEFLKEYLFDTLGHSVGMANIIVFKNPHSTFTLQLCHGLNTPEPLSGKKDAVVSFYEINLQLMEAKIDTGPWVHFRYGYDFITQKLWVEDMNLHCYLLEFLRESCVNSDYPQFVGADLSTFLTN